VIAYSIRRFLQIIPTLFVVATLAFVLVRLVPGGPFDSDRQLPVEVMKQINAKYHLDASLWDQYTSWLSGVLFHADLGPTYKYPNRTVNEIIGASLPISLQLGSLAMLFALSVGIPLGVIGATRRNTKADTLAMGTAMLGVAVPRFVLAPVLVLIFALKLYLLPVARWETWRHMILPVICAGLPAAAYIARLTRGGMLEVLQSDFIRTARAKGLSERTVIWKHALKGGMLPVVSYLGPGMSGLLVGSLIVEKIFNVPGMGRYFVEAALNRDYCLLIGVLLVYGFLLMFLNLLVDLAYAKLDPRVELR
jgi:oligopeptide transport system permease protein